MSDVGAVIMLGPGGKSRAEQLLYRATQAAGVDLIEALAEERLAPIVLAVADAQSIQHPACILDPDAESFHFGQRLAGLIERYQMAAVLYFGAASAPLLPKSIVGWIRATLEAALRSGLHLAITNNLHSSDWVAFTVDNAVLPILQQVGRDNSLAWLLQQQGDYQVIRPEGMRPAWAFDLDTPADLAIVREHPNCPPHLRVACQDALLDRIPLASMLDTLARDGSRVALIGRVAPQAWTALNEVTQCWLRVFAEERGMVASERLARGEVRSLLARLVDLLGPQGFFDELAGMVDAAIIDSRVLMAAAGHYPAADERFSSDLFLVEAITDEWLYAFTQAAAAAPIPVLLGGHSVVGGGLHMLAELVSRRRAGG